MGVAVLAGCGGKVVSEWDEGASLTGGSKPNARVCMPGEYRCEGNLLIECKQASDGFTPVVQCPVQCNAVAGNCGVCIPGRPQCESATSLSICSDDGMSEANVPCPEAKPWCFDGACVQCLDASTCAPSSKPCLTAACDIQHACTEQAAPPGTPCAAGKQCTASGQCCIVSSVEARLWPLDIYFMVDRSASMQDGAWNNQSNALREFFNSASSAGVSVGLRFFPLDNVCLAQDFQCTGNNYASPLVPWGRLPEHAYVLEQAIASTTPNGCFSPTEEALHGVLIGATQRKQAFADHVVVAVLVSDGGPCCQDCPIEEPEGLGQIAADYLIGPPSVSTFAIFLDPKASKVMTSIAQNGGTTKAFDGGGSSEAFVGALKEIQAQSIPCQLDTSGAVLNPNLASLEFSPASGGASYSIPRVADPSQCDLSGDWYFDNPVSPQLIQLCPSFCNQLKHDPGSRITMFLECD
jgi:hypothetical protein